MQAYERLLKYAAIRTPSDEESATVPSSACQFELAQHLYRELFTMGITDVKVDTQCYLYAHIPATPGYENRPKLGFIAHLDTVSDFCDHRIIPEIHEDYNGRELPLGTSGRVLSMFPIRQIGSQATELRSSVQMTRRESPRYNGLPDEKGKKFSSGKIMPPHRLM